MASLLSCSSLPSPRQGFTKLNVNGWSFDTDHRAGFGCHLTDDCGGWLVGISGFLGNTSILYAELFAVERGLLLAWDWGIRKLLCHSDSLMAVTLVSDNLDYHHQYAGLMADIQNLLGRDWEVQVQHTLRGMNSCADLLAKKGARDDDALKVWLLPPLPMKCLMINDSMDVPCVYDYTGTSNAVSSSTSSSTEPLDEDTKNLDYDSDAKNSKMQARTEEELAQALTSQVASSHLGSSSPSRLEPGTVSWEFTPEGFTKLNVEGSLCESHDRAGFGCLLKDDCGAWIVGISGFLGNVSILYAELIALKRGLILAWDWGIRMLLCHSDSLMVVSLVSGDLDYQHEYAGLVADIQNLLERDWEVHVERTPSKGVSSADWLAKQGANDVDALKIWLLPPLPMNFSLMGEDSMDVPCVYDFTGTYEAGTSLIISSPDEDTENPDYDLELIEAKNAIMQARMEEELIQAQLAQDEPRIVCWVCPPQGFAKLNVDGSFYEKQQKAGFGCLLRDDCGTWVVGISGFLENSSILHAELAAVERGLLLAWDWGIRKLICHSDSMTVVSLVSNGGNHDRHQFAGLLANIQELLQRDWQVQVEHTLREGNSCADWLAKDGAKDDVVLKVWLLAPPSMGDLLMDDFMGVPSLRPSNQKTVSKLERAVRARLRGKR
ncbi:hypothetical protein HN51_043650 [Arachis hypogaea]|uniref:uncharacterized protein LOC107613587 isoform X1 n=1 Tax=Arachis ipaensis TaxID=130454 RepID=UPI0007AEF2B2|nr:uncharacterized protein LOC107613587 isoform X1 [Arachis ipaensis]XP_020964561.1 uncharacterized protein LOC107613587 isoform X1 [Arachis ipaensis]XP_020964562.1 uncharacterized protein LOC107613587 isoform X1 [Arachis ipaensis]XP_029151001.1 uncharacterized protein LOC112771404 isoform X2 [Arachis hypogaea]QHN95710.1 Putative ribonuclease H protein [Arachis hypogaea]QHN95711.1 Putative ribonuclease H protein [Arachis hypogaea]QHN95712.1 Putative ribonuclease H protein [Arachis hypogaea]